MLFTTISETTNKLTHFSQSNWGVFAASAQIIGNAAFAEFGWVRSGAML